MQPGATEILMFPAVIVYISILREIIPSRSMGNIIMFVLLVVTYVLLKREEGHEAI